MGVTGNGRASRARKGEGLEETDLPGARPAATQGFLSRKPFLSAPLPPTVHGMARFQSGPMWIHESSCVQGPAHGPGSCPLLSPLGIVSHCLILNK